jgi:hypothetical protein
MATRTGLHRTLCYYIPSTLKQLANTAAEVELDLIGYVTAKMPFNSPRQLNLITKGLEGGLSSLFLHFFGYFPTWKFTIFNFF